MGPYSWAKDLDEAGADNDIPDEISGCQRLDQPRGACVAIYTLNGAVLHVISLFICEHNP